MDTLFRDLRHAVRSLRRTPGFTIAALLILFPAAIAFRASASLACCSGFQSPVATRWISSSVTR